MSLQQALLSPNPLPSHHPLLLCSPWPVLESLQGKVMVVLIQRGGSGEAAAFQEAFPDLSECLCVSLSLCCALWHCGVCDSSVRRQRRGGGLPRGVS